MPGVSPIADCDSAPAYMTKYGYVITQECPKRTGGALPRALSRLTQVLLRSTSICRWGVGPTAGPACREAGLAGPALGHARGYHFR